ncbi:MAG: hypothetical protein ACI9OJ_000740 [Myxococcota bacterium]|jgi:hypothetical protein
MKSTMKVLLVFVVAASMLACNDVPIAALSDSFSVNVSVSKENNDPVQVDFLWVIDNSASMCQEQSSLADSFSEFITRITSFVNIDYRIAVVTTDMLSADKGHVGQFRYHKTTQIPFACSEALVQACVSPDKLPEASDELKALCPAGDCSCSNVGDNWTCDAPAKVGDILNCNVANGTRTLNSKCKIRCSAHHECDEGLAGAEQGEACKNDESQCIYRCLGADGPPDLSGCVRRPDTELCPDNDGLRDVLLNGGGTVCKNGEKCTDSQPCADGSACERPIFPYITPATAAAYFKCVGIVGAEQHNNANLEQGLNAAIWALHPNGPNADQGQAFLRENAYLVVVFVSDEDDCSTADCSEDEDGLWSCGHRMKKELFGRCTCLEDASKGGQMRPVSEAVNMIKSLKNDPGRVLVAAIVGDSLSDDTDVVDGERSQYLNSKCNNSGNDKYECVDDNYDHAQLFNTYMCESTAGKADLGKRYIEFVRAFGANGILTNICSDAGVGPALGQIADRIIRVFTKVCLPRRVEDNATLVVKLVGPQGTCGDGSACCAEVSTECTAATECADASECTLSQREIPFGETPDTETYRIETTSDCPAESDNKALVFNALLAPGTDLVIDYQATSELQTQQ